MKKNHVDSGSRMHVSRCQCKDSQSKQCQWLLSPYSTIEAAHDAASAGDGSRGDCRVEAYTPSGMMLATANWPKGQNELSLSVGQAPKGSVVMVKVTDIERGMQVLRRIIMKTHL